MVHCHPAEASVAFVLSWIDLANAAVPSLACVQ